MVMVWKVFRCYESVVKPLPYLSSKTLTGVSNNGWHFFNINEPFSFRKWAPLRIGFC